MGNKSSTKPAHPPRGSKHRVRQAANRANYDLQVLCDILDACSIGHVSFVHDDWPMSIPTAIARMDDFLYLHGSTKSRLYQHLASAEPVSVSVCLVDGLVKARSAFHCSMNYRSAVVFGCAESISGDEKSELLYRFTEHLIPLDRSHYRPHLAKELKATELVRLPLTETSAKIRTGGPIDDDEDLSSPYWAGEIPIISSFGEAVSATDLTAGIRVPDSL